MNQEYFQALLDASEVLGSKKIYDSIQQMQSVYKERQYFVAFIGQFSAGKSCLINNILKRQLLPEGTMETTPMLTYIRYGEREEAKLHYDDGAVQIIELAQVTQIAQQVETNRWDLEQLEYLEIYLHEEMLRSGMILLDTPGFNTLIEKHEHLLETSLSLAASILYVSGNAPSLVDVGKLSMLTKEDFDVSFVRTHCDEIKEEEESLKQVRTTDRVVLEKCGIGSERCYYVSNKSSSPYYAALEPLRGMLTEKGKCASEELESAMERHLLAIAKQCRAELENRHTLLDQVHHRNAEAVEKQRLEKLNRIEQLASRLERNEEAISRKIESCRRSIQEDVKQQLEADLKASKGRIEKTGITEKNEMYELLRREADDFSRRVDQLLNDYLDPLVKEVNGGISTNEIGSMVIDLPQVSGYQELCSEQDEIAEELRGKLIAIQKSREALTQALTESANSPEYLQLQHELQDLQIVLMELQQERTDLLPYEPQMIVEEDGRMQPSQIAGCIGAAADWAMLLIPGAQVEAALVKFAKVPQVASKLGKAVGIIEKFGKAVKKGDTVKDILFTLDKVSKHTRTSKRRQKIALNAAGKLAKGVGTGVDALHAAKQNSDTESFLDYLTVEHWARQFGAQFDRPSRLVVDAEYEAQYKEAKRQMEAAYREMQQKAYQKKIEMGLLQNEEERRRAKEESLRIDQEAVSRELSRRESILRESARQETLKKWRLACANGYYYEMEKHLQAIIDSYVEAFPARIDGYQNQRLQTIRNQMEKEQASYDELQNTSEAEVEKELRQVTEILERMQNVFNG